MAYQLIWSPTARLDLRSIFDYIAEDRPWTAQRFVGSIVQAVERLPTFPESGRIVPEFGDPTIREIIHKPCRIVYRVRKEQGVIEVARVWHAARGIPEL